MDPIQPVNDLDTPADAPTPEGTPEMTPEMTPEAPQVTPTPDLTPSEAPVSAPEPVSFDQPIVAAADPVAPAPTPAPTAPAFPAQPFAGQPIASSDVPVPTNSQPKSKKGLMIGLIAGAGGLVIVGVVLILSLFVFGGSDFKKFKAALENKKATNCTVSKDDDSMTVQANDGWSKFRVQYGSTNLIALEDENTVYMWTGTSSGYQMDYTSSIKSQIESLSSTASGIDGTGPGETIKCEANSKADFTPPSDIKFTKY